MSGDQLHDVTITLGAATFVLRADMLALSRMEEAFRVPTWQEALAKFGPGMSIKDTCLVVQCLIDVEDEAARPDVGAILRALRKPEDYAAANTKIAAAIAAAMPRNQDDTRADGEGATENPPSP